MAWFVCPVFLKPYHMEGEGDHGWRWCNHTDKAGPWCVIVAVMLILWTPERIFPMCVCVWMFMWVHVGTWYLGAGSSSAEAGGPSRLPCVDWLVCEFFRGLLRGPHCSHACMTHGAVSVFLSVWPSAQSCTTASWCCLKKSHRAGFYAQRLWNTFIHRHSSRDISVHTPQSMHHYARAPQQCFSYVA